MRARNAKGLAHAIRCFCLLGSLAMVFSQAALASCGLDGCPVLLGRPDTQRRDFLMQTMIRQVGFDMGLDSGDYTQLTARFEYTGWERWGLGAYASFVALRAGSDDSFGLGNPVLYGEYRLLRSVDRSVSIGCQLELPLGDSEDHIAADHFEALPYVGARQAFGSFYASGNLGLRMALGQGHEADEPPGHDHGHKRTMDAPGEQAHGADGHLVFVNPHEDQELLYRVGFGRDFGKRQITPELFLDGQSVLAGDHAGTAFVSAGVMVKISVGRRYQLHPLVAVPVSSARRFEWATGVGFTATL